MQKTRQITRAMRMVAAAKLRRAQDRIIAFRPYADRMSNTLGELVSRQSDAEHPLLVPHDETRHLELVVVSSDRGLAGAFNTNVLRFAQNLILEREPSLKSVNLTLYGRKGRDFFRRRFPNKIRDAVVGIREVEYGHAASLARTLAERYEKGEVDEVVVVYSKFVSAMTQVPRVEQILPVSAPEKSAEEAAADTAPFSAEPSEKALLAMLVPKALEVRLYHALLESQAGEHAARMTAMESATRNSEEMIDRLTLQYNRARQAAITKELVEIVTGAEAL